MLHLIAPCYFIEPNFFSVDAMKPRYFHFALVMFLAANAAAARTLVFESTKQPSPEKVSPPGSYERAQSQIVASSSSNPGVQVVAASDAPVGMSANSELFFMLEQLQMEVSTLRGLVEEQSFEIQQLKENDKSRYRDLDNRLLDLSRRVNEGGATGSNSSNSDASYRTPAVVPAAESASVASPVATRSPMASDAPTEEQKRAYQEAYAFITEKKFDAAIERFHAFLEKYPEGDLAGNAYYWLGEVYLAQPQLDQARQSFLVVVNSFPAHRKVSDALFKLAVTFDRLQDSASSERYLNEVLTRFPDSTAAKLAKTHKMSR